VGVGEAVTSFLGDKGVPGFATRTLIRPPQSQLGPIQETRRAEVIQASDLEQKYRHVLDRVSAYEILNQRAQAAAAAAEAVAEEHPTEEIDDTADRRVYNSARRIGGAGPARRLSKPRDERLRQVVLVRRWDVPWSKSCRGQQGGGSSAAFWVDYLSGARVICVLGGCLPPRPPESILAKMKARLTAAAVFKAWEHG